MIILTNKLERAESIFEKVVFSKLFCYLLPFLGLGTWLMTQETHPAGGYYLIQYLYTYDHGYVSRGFVGEVISWFADRVTDSLTQAILIAFSWALMVSASLCMGKALSLVRKDKQKFYITLSVLVFMSVLPFSFRLYFPAVRFDKLVWAIALLAIFLSDKKYGVWLAPVLCALATLINPVFVFTSMVLVAIILLQEFRSSGYSKKNLAVCIISYVSIIAIALFAPISQKYLGFENPKEMVDFYFARYDGVLDEEIYSYFVNEWLLDFFTPVKDIFGYTFGKYFGGGGIRGIIFASVVAVPLYIIFEYIWKNAIKTETDKFQKFIFFLCAIAPVVIIPAVIISWDVSKYVGNTVLVQFGLVVYYFVKGNTAVCNAVNKVADFFRNNIFVSAVAILYALIIIIN